MDLKNITNFKNYIIYFMVLISVIIIYILYIIYNSYDSYKLFLDKGYEYKIIGEFISNNLTYFISFLSGYLLLLGIISSKKGLISLTEYNNYYKIITYIYRGLGFLSIAFIIYLFKKSNIYEIIILLLDSGFSVFIGFFTLSYVKNIQELETLEYVNDNGNKEEDIFKVIYNFFTISLNYYTGTVLIIAFLFIPIGIYLNFNLFTIIYIHLTFIISYTCLNILNNRFAPIVNIGYNDKVYKNYYLLENLKDQIIITNKKHSLILKPEKLDYIEIKKK